MDDWLDTLRVWDEHGHLDVPLATALLIAIVTFLTLAFLTLQGAQRIGLYQKKEGVGDPRGFKNKQKKPLQL
jgi:hypothetical protein